MSRLAHASAPAPSMLAPVSAALNGDQLACCSLAARNAHTHPRSHTGHCAFAACKIRTGRSCGFVPSLVPAAPALHGAACVRAPAIQRLCPAARDFLFTVTSYKQASCFGSIVEVRVFLSKETRRVSTQAVVACPRVQHSFFSAT